MVAALGKLRQDDHQELTASLGYIVVQNQPQLHSKTLSNKQKKNFYNWSKWQENTHLFYFHVCTCSINHTSLQWTSKIQFNLQTHRYCLMLNNIWNLLRLYIFFPLKIKDLYSLMVWLAYSIISTVPGSLDSLVYTIFLHTMKHLPQICYHIYSFIFHRA